MSKRDGGDYEGEVEVEGKSREQVQVKMDSRTV
jgi:hypothetical protein